MDRSELLTAVYEEFTGREYNPGERGSIHIVFARGNQAMVTTCIHNIKEQQVTYGEDTIII